PDAIELALSPRTASSIAEGLSFVGFEPLELEDIPQEAVQARTWGDQANLTVGVRYGRSAEIGSRRVMEDRTVAVADIFKADATPSFRSRSEGFFPSATILSRNSSSPRTSGQDETARRRIFPSGVGAQTTPGAVATAAVGDPAATAGTGVVVPENAGTGGLAATKEDKETTEGRGGASGQEKQRSPRMSPSPSTPLCAAFFGVYDGHDGDAVAEALQKGLHKLIAKQKCFTDSISAAIEHGCYEMDIACLDAQFRLLGRDRSRSPSPSPSPSRSRSPSRSTG
ncbi:unnamed protein product, partial [Ectocarpus sp. 4 AP-2014]